MRFRKTQGGSWWWLGKLCEIPKCLLWRGLKCHCPMYNISCILCLLFECLPVILHGWILSGQTLHVHILLDFCLFLFFYFLIIFYWLCYYSCPDISPFAPSTQHHPPQAILYPCSCWWVMCVSSLATTLFPILYFTFPWLFYNYLFVLNPLTFSLILPHTPPIWQPGN